MSLVDDLFALTNRAGNRDQFCVDRFRQVIPTDNGRITIILDCLGQWQIYDILSRSIAPIPFTFHLNNGLAGGSADGSRIYVGVERSRLPGPIHIFESLSNTVSSSLTWMTLEAISVSGNASRVILQNTDVHSRSLTLLGKLPPHGVALASRDSSRAFVYVDSAAGARLDVYNLNGPLQPGALYPLTKTVTLSDSANGAGDIHPYVVMTSSLDDTAVFVSGDSRVLIVPVD